MSEHIPPDLALILVALDQDDPERRASLAHAARCPECARILSDGQAMLKLIDAQVSEVRIDPRLKARILDAVARAPEQHRGTRWEHIALTLGALLSVWLAWFDGHARTGLYPARGAYCVLWEMLGATLALIGVGAWAMRTSQRPDPLRLGIVAMCGALVGQLWLRWRCPTHDAGLHILVYHVSGVVLLALLGLLAGRASWRRA
jgi:hypothetical protein